LRIFLGHSLSRPIFGSQSSPVLTRAQRSDPQIPYARNTVWAGIGNLVDLHQGERKLAMVDFNRFKPQAQTVPRQPAMKGRFV
jgi:hypothetical protein